MSGKVFCDLSISADGYLAGPGQTADRPFGDGPVERGWWGEDPPYHAPCSCSPTTPASR